MPAASCFNKDTHKSLLFVALKRRPLALIAPHYLIKRTLSTRGARAPGQGRQQLLKGRSRGLEAIAGPLRWREHSGVPEGFPLASPGWPSPHGWTLGGGLHYSARHRAPASSHLSLRRERPRHSSHILGPPHIMLTDVLSICGGAATKPHSHRGSCWATRP